MAGPAGRGVHWVTNRFQVLAWSVGLAAAVLSLRAARSWAEAPPTAAIEAPANGSAIVLSACDPCDPNCDLLHDVADIPPFVDRLVNEVAGCSPCSGDVDASGTLDGHDVQPFIDCLLTPVPTGACCTGAASCQITTQAACAGLWLGAGVECQSGACAFANLTGFRPQHGAGYFPFPKTAVADSDEASDSLGPGIRINAPGDSDPAGEDDLIEVLVETDRPEIPLSLRRGDAAIRAWTTRTKAPGSEVLFVGDQTGALLLGAGNPTLTLWVEWAAVDHGIASLSLEPLAAGYAMDELRFHIFRSIVMALGGEDQVPSVPVDPNHGTFVVAVALYQQGYDAHIHDEDDVAADGSGPAYNELVAAISQRRVSGVAVFGYSHGGGSTYDLSDRLDNNRAGIGVFEIAVTSYVDGVENDSDFDVQQELRRPPSTAYHANHYQVGSFSDFFLDGGPVPNSDPTPSGLNVETTPWGAGATHFLVDDYAQVRGFIETNLVGRLSR